MEQILLALFSGMGLAILLILKENKKLKSDKKLHDIEVEDAQLSANQKNIEDKKQEVKKELKELEKNQAPDLEDDKIEKYWNDKKL